MTEEQPKIKKFLKLIDVFSYVPVPQAYPVSTNKSKIGSVLFLAILLGYLIYDFYNYITNNIPIVYPLQADGVNKGNITVPAFAFGMYYSDPNSSSSTQYILNNASYFQYTLQSTYISIVDNKTVTKYTKIPTRDCYPVEWASKQYGNLTCANLSAEAIQQMNITYPVVDEEGSMIMSESSADGVVTDYYFRLRISLCSGSKCASQQNLTYFLQNSVFLFLARQSTGYDFKTGLPISPDHVKVFRYFISNKTSSLVALYVTPTRFLRFPNLITKFKTEQTQYSRFTREVITNLTYRQSYAMRLRFYPQWTMDIVEIHPQTIIQRMSQWSAFSSLIFMIAAVCFLGYNRRKFNRKNPDWERFDQMLKEKLEIEMQPLDSLRNQNITESQKNNEESLAHNQQSIPQAMRNQQNKDDIENIPQPDFRGANQLMQSLNEAPVLPYR